MNGSRDASFLADGVSSSAWGASGCAGGGGGGTDRALGNRSRLMSPKSSGAAEGFSNPSGRGRLASLKPAGRARATSLRLAAVGPPMLKSISGDESGFETSMSSSSGGSSGGFVGVSGGGGTAVSVFGGGDAARTGGDIASGGRGGNTSGSADEAGGEPVGTSAGMKRWPHCRHTSGNFASASASS